MPLKKALFITAANRPAYFRETMNSWRKVRRFYDWHVFFRLEPTEFLDEHLEIIDELEHPSSAVIVNPQVYGVLEHPYVGFKHLFGLYFDFVVRAEDDLVVSEDILEYFHWASNEYHHEKSVGAVLGFSEESGPEDEVRRVDHFSPWVWATWWDRWDNHIGPTWDHDYSTYNGYPGNEAGWDWNLNTRIFPQRGLQSVAPAASRVQNIGVWGVHGTPENFRESPSFEFERPVTKYVER